MDRRAAASAFGELRRKVAARGVHRRPETEHERRRTAGPRAECERSPVERELVHARHGCEHSREQRNEPVGAGAAGSRAGGRDDRYFPHQRADDVSARSADRLANRQLAPAAAELDEHESGDIGDRDRQEERHRPEDERERVAILANAQLLQVPDRHRPSLVRRRILFAERLLDAFQIAGGLLDRDACLQSPDAAHEARGANGQETWRCLRRQPDVDSRAREPSRHHADDRIGGSAKNEAPADRRPIASETACPEALADDRRVRSTGALLVCGKGAAGARRHAEDVEVARRDAAPVQAFWLGACCVRDALGIGGRQGGERRGGATPVLEPPRRNQADRLAPGRVGFHDGHQPLGIREREPFEQYRIDHREHRGGRGDADGQRKSGDEGEAWSARERAAGDAERCHARISPHVGRPQPPDRWPGSERCAMASSRYNWRPVWRSTAMIDRRLKTLIVIYLSLATVEDTVIFLLAWLAPDLWFRLFHAGVPAGLETALLRRSAGQWAAFALAQAITLWRWPKDPRLARRERRHPLFRLFTDVSYILAVPSLTPLGWMLLTPPPFLNAIGVVILLHGYRQSQQR